MQRRSRGRLFPNAASTSPFVAGWRLVCKGPLSPTTDSTSDCLHSQWVGLQEGVILSQQQDVLLHSNCQGPTLAQIGDTSNRAWLASRSQPGIGHISRSRSRQPPGPSQPRAPGIPPIRLHQQKASCGASNRRSPDRVTIRTSDRVRNMLSRTVAPSLWRLFISALPSYADRSRHATSCRNRPRRCVTGHESRVTPASPSL